MALIDVTDVLLDPDFADSLVLERIMKTVGDDGVAIETSTKKPFRGVVTNDTGDQLRRGDQGEHTQGNILVHSRLTMNEGDVVQWQGRRYTVTSVADWSHFGRGFVAASCELIPLSG